MVVSVQDKVPATLAQRRPGRPRSQEVDRAILSATLDLLSEHGYLGLSIEGIADRAGVGKATIYRRWNDKLSVVVAALRGLPEVPIPDSGDLRTDIRSMSNSLIKMLSNTQLGHVLGVFAAERMRTVDGFEQIEEFMLERTRPWHVVIGAAIERGELPEDTDVELLTSLLTGPILQRKFWTGGKLDRKTLDAFVDAVFYGIQPKPIKGGARVTGVRSATRR